MHFSKRNNGCWGSPKNYQDANGVKWAKGKYQWLGFSLAKCHIIAVFDFMHWLLIKKIYLSSLGNVGGNSAKLTNDCYCCCKRQNTPWMSKILGRRFENEVKGKIKQFGVRDVIQFPFPPRWRNLKTEKNADKIRK